MRKSLSFLTAAAALLGASQAMAAVNILPGHIPSGSISGVSGVLRDATWSVGSTPSSPFAAFDNFKPPEGTQWNNSSFWWDQDPSVNVGQLFITFNLDASYTISSLSAQADDNDSYRVEYWDGSNWLTAWDIPTKPSFGLVTRDSGALTPFTTNRLRFSATGGDNYYALGELQAFVAGAVPEPASWMMLIGGFVLVGAALRRRDPLAVRVRLG